MAELKHIVLDEDVLLSHMPFGLGKLTLLQTLSVFVVGKGIGCKLNELSGLIHLRGKLTIKNLENMTNARDSVAANLKGKANLETLKFVWNENVLSKDVNKQEIAGDVLETLQPLQGLKGLEIEGFGGAKFSQWMMEPKQKANLGTFKLVCNENVLSKAVNQQEIATDVLETLQPPQGLKGLEIEGYGGAKFSQWMMEPSIPYLLTMAFVKCRKCENLPPFGKFPYLNKLMVCEMDALEVITDGDSLKERRSWFPSLKTLHLLSLPNLLLWARMEEESLPCLVDLTIYDCPKLKTMPLLPSLEKCKLYICSQKLIYSLLKTIPKKNPTPASAIYSLATLKFLEIGGCGDLVCLPEEVIQGLSSLVSLTILDCENLNCLSGMQYLTALESLDLVRCKELHLLQGMDGLTSLQTLVITQISKLAYVPEGLQNSTKLHTLLIRDCENLKALPLASTLRYLAIIGCESLLSWPNGLRELTSLTCLGISCSSNMLSLTDELQLLTALSSLVIVGAKDLITLPEWIRSITLLRHLLIYDCPDLGCLPQWMECLTALEELKIGSCHYLTSRCQKDKGEDWLKISHVPIIHIDGMQIQKTEV